MELFEENPGEVLARKLRTATESYFVTTAICQALLANTDAIGRQIIDKQASISKLIDSICGKYAQITRRLQQTSSLQDSYRQTVQRLLRASKQQEQSNKKRRSHSCAPRKK